MIELLVVITIAAILAFFAVPDLTDFVRNNRSSADINDLLSSVTYARSEAVKLNSSVTVCQSSNGSSCEDSTGGWGAGWLVFEDRNRDGVVDDSGDILRIANGIGNGRSLSFSDTRIIYRGNGLATAGTNQTFTLCDGRGTEHVRGLIIGASGRPRVAVASGESTTPLDAGGNALSCGSGSSDPSEPTEPTEPTEPVGEL